MIFFRAYCVTKYGTAIDSYMVNRWEAQDMNCRTYILSYYVKMIFIRIVYLFIYLIILLFCWLALTVLLESM